MNDAWQKAESWLRPARFAMILAILVAIQFPTVLVGAETFFFRDYGFFGYPLAAYHRECFWRGEIPFWNPYNNAGLPFLAQWNTMVLYPGSLIYLLLPLPWSLAIFCLFHQFLAGLGMYLLGRDTAKSNLAGAIAGIAFAFSGLLLCSLKWPNNIAAFGLMPWVVWRCLRATNLRAIGIAALVGAAQMLSGAPEVILLTWVIASVMILGESVAQRSPKPILHLTVIVLLVAAIAAAQLWPFLDLLKLSQRTESFAGSDWPMPIWGWANFLLPLYGTFPSYHGVPAQPNQYWVSTYFVPLGALVLATISLKMGWRARVAAGIALVGALLALGEGGLLYAGLRKAFPGLGFMRFPIKFVILPAFIFPWLAAFGMARLRNECDRKRLFIADTIIVIALILLPLGQPSVAGSHSMWTLYKNALCRIFFLILFVRFLSRIADGVRPVSGILVLGVLWLDGVSQAPTLNPLAQKWVFDRGLPTITNSPSLGFGRAMIEPDAALKLDHLILEKPEDDIGTSRRALFCNDNLIDGVPKVDGFYSLYLRESAQLIDLMYARTNQNFPGLEKALCVSHRTARGKTGEWIEGERASWIRGGPQAVFANRRDTIQGLLAPGFDPATTIYLPENAKKPDFGGAVTLIDMQWAAEKIKFTTKATQSGWVFVSQAFHPGWRATANGAPISIERANHAFQGLAIPTGDIHIEMVYREPHFVIGSIISALGIVLSGIAISRRA